MSNVLINGVNTEYIDVMDRGLHYGDGLFETILYSAGKLQFWSQHLLRMSEGAEKLGIDFPGEQCFLDDVTALIGNVDSEDIIIKLILTRGSGPRGYTIKAKTTPLRVTSVDKYLNQEQHQALARDGIHMTVCSQGVSINKGLAGLKHLNRLENVIARNEWKDEYDEGLMLDHDQNVIEGTMSNLFIVKDGVLCTPDLSYSGVAGIMKQNILAIAEKNDMPIHIQQIPLDALFDADEIFVSNSIIGIWPVVKIDTNDYKIGDVCASLQAKLTDQIDQNAYSLK